MPGLDRSKSLLLVGVGGFAGAVLRYAVATALSGSLGLAESVGLPASLGLPGPFPWGTLAVNVAGSFALGVVLFEERLVGRLGPELRLLVATGFLSSFTTYSTFAAETAALSPTLAVANVGANYALGFAAVLAGRLAVRSLAAPEVAR